MLFIRSAFTILIAFFLPLSAFATESADINDGNFLHPLENNINEGELQFLTSPPEKGALHSRNILTVTEQSLLNGWVSIDQCHEQLDPMQAVEVVYRYKNMRNLHIVETKNISRAWKEGNSIRLEDVSKNAKLCIQLEAKILYDQTDGTYVLRNGPFERRFLDGYFPMHVNLLISYPEGKLKFIKSQPHAAPGFDVALRDGNIVIESWFEGKLTIEIYFRLVI
jgi:hypothetical protein